MRIVGALRLKNFDVSHMFGYKLSIIIFAQSNDTIKIAMKKAITKTMRWGMRVLHTYRRYSGVHIYTNTNTVQSFRRFNCWLYRCELSMRMKNWILKWVSNSCLADYWHNFGESKILYSLKFACLYVYYLHMCLL